MKRQRKLHYRSWNLPTGQATCCGRSGVETRDPLAEPMCKTCYRHPLHMDELREALRRQDQARRERLLREIGVAT